MPIKPSTHAGSNTPSVSTPQESTPTKHGPCREKLLAVANSFGTGSLHKRDTDPITLPDVKCGIVRAIVALAAQRANSEQPVEGKPMHSLATPLKYVIGDRSKPLTWENIKAIASSLKSESMQDFPPETFREDVIADVLLHGEFKSARDMSDFINACSDFGSLTAMGDYAFACTFLLGKKEERPRKAMIDEASYLLLIQHSIEGLEQISVPKQVNSVKNIESTSPTNLL